jgi:ABC-2 type transport system permease protein
VHWVHAIRYTSPIFWGVGANQLHDGATPAQVVLLVVVTGAVLSLLAVRSFERLDVH